MPADPLNIVMIEDDEISGYISEHVVRKAGHSIDFWAKDGESAIAYLKDHKADLILLDLNLPAIDGFDILDQIRENHIQNQGVIAILTSSSRSSDKLKAEESGKVDRYILKPLDRSSFLDLVDLSAEKKTGAKV